jgi:hypothetical protein
MSEFVGWRPQDVPFIVQYSKIRQLSACRCDITPVSAQQSGPPEGKGQSIKLGAYPATNDSRNAWIIQIPDSEQRNRMNGTRERCRTGMYA